MAGLKKQATIGVGKIFGSKKAAAAAQAAAAQAARQGGSIGAIAGRSQKAAQAAMSASHYSTGRRVLIRGAMASPLAGVGMYKNRDGSRGGYRAPSTRTPRGTGRYA